MRVLRQQETDRIPIWLWGVDPNRPKDGSPRYIKKHPIETIQDAEKWLSIPHHIAEPNVEVDYYFELKRKTGDRTARMAQVKGCPDEHNWWIVSLCI
jgi:hypothetical protein